MLNKKVVAVIMGALNEETQIKKVLDTIPNFVDKVIITNDGSSDKTLNILKTYIKNGIEPKKIFENDPNITNTTLLNKDPKKDKFIVLDHAQNAGKGATIATGYKWCIGQNYDCIATMDSDGQMDPKQLVNLCVPVVNGEADYTKANRLIHRSALFVIPKVRYFGNSILSFLTKIASGYWKVSDTQTGYTAISIEALQAIKSDNLFKYYGYPNHMLVKLNIANCSIKEIPMKPIYNVGEKSKLNIFKVILKLSPFLLKLFIQRLYVKYLFRDFHPLFILYNFGIFSGLISFIFGIKVVQSIELGVALEWQYFAVFGLFFISSLQSISFAMWMDMMDNEDLYIK
jgi:glycosyltransferase involved in cell wall biosynthesis